MDIGTIAVVAKLRVLGLDQEADFVEHIFQLNRVIAKDIGAVAQRTEDMSVKMFGLESRIVVFENQQRKAQEKEQALEARVLQLERDSMMWYMPLVAEKFRRQDAERDAQLQASSDDPS